MDRASSARLLWGLVLVGLLAALLPGYGPLAGRLRMERASRMAEVALDYDSYSEFFHAQGIDEDTGFRDMHRRGASAVAFNESYLSALQLAGHLKLYSGLDVSKYRSIENLPPGAAVPARQYLVVYDDGTFGDLKNVLGILVGADKVSEWGRPAGTVTASPTTPRVLEVIGSERFLTGVGLGFSATLADHFRRMGFNIVLRPENKTSVAPDMIRRYFAAMPKADYVVFGGTRNEALGFPVPECLDAVLEQLGALQLRLGIVEVPSPKSALKGEEYLAQHYCQMAVRVQSIMPAQLSRLSPDDAIDMFRLGVRERNVRMVFLRPFTDPDEDKTLTQTNNDYVESVAKMIRENGFGLGVAAVFPDVVRLPWWSTLLLNLAVGASLSLLLLAFRPQSSLALLALGPAGMLAGAVGAGVIHHAETWSKLSALVVGLSMPSLAMMQIQAAFERAGTKGDRTTAVLFTLRWFGLATGISLSGGILVASLLAYTPFMLEIDQFRGIKLLMIVPPLVVLLYAAVRQGISIWAVTRYFWRLPLTVGGSLCLLVVLAGGAFYIMRTGNTPETGASDLERHLRVFLQAVFVARPRFKDFCIGHPAFVLLGMLSVYSGAGVLRLRKMAFWFLLALATIGQADIVDTFAHIHTPFLISLLRVFHGCWLGLLVGFALSFFIRPGAKVVPPAVSPPAAGSATPLQPMAGVI